ncbi:MAG: S4 domain-containing protein [Pseudomonadota bacterium]
MIAEVEDAGGQRIDKWLTYARFAKTRTVAQSLVVGGKVRINRPKFNECARKVSAGYVLTIRVGRTVSVIRVLGFSSSRVAPSNVVHLYAPVEDIA